MGKINILIVHFNTPNLTECLVKSINKFSPDSNIYIFDNSDKLPFTAKFDNVTIFDNTKGEIIDFDKWLEKYPNRFESGGKINKWGSAKHCLSVEKCMTLIEGNFILIDSDVLIKRDISDLFLPQYIYVGEVYLPKFLNRQRVLPYICFINSDECKKHNIHYFDENRIHGLKKEDKHKDCEKYDTGASFYHDCGNLPAKKIAISDYIVHFGGASWVEEKKTTKSIVHYTVEQWLRKYAKYWAGEEEYEKNRNKNVVYTCITGNYEPLSDPEVVSNGFDYICFTDSKDMVSDVWEFRPMPEEVKDLSSVKQQRCVKIRPHKYLPEYELSVWVDGSVKLIGDLNRYIEETCRDGSIFIPSHPTRKCIYKEEQAVVSAKKDKKSITQPQIQRYRKEGFPERYGLVQSNIIIRRHNDPSCAKLMETWWNEVRNGSHRDQLSFDYSRWINKDVKVVFLDKDTCHNEFFNWDKYHGKGTIKHNPIVPAVSTIKKTDKKKSLLNRSYIGTVKKNNIAMKNVINDKLNAFLYT